MDRLVKGMQLDNLPVARLQKALRGSLAPLTERLPEGRSREAAELTVRGILVAAPRL